MTAGPNYARLTDLMGVEWQDQPLLEHALRDESYVNEHRALPLTNNKNLAFLGDAVIELIVRRDLFIQNPKAALGELSTKTDRVVTDEVLAQAARRLGLGPLLAIGNQRRDEDNTTVLARAFEALVAAVYLHKDLLTATELTRRWLDIQPDPS
jgi:dsRNA-specific ribonuclease